MHYKLSRIVGINKPRELMQRTFSGFGKFLDEKYNIGISDISHPEVRLTVAIFGDDNENDMLMRLLQLSKHPNY